jgi:diaminopimelate epimerase
MTRWPPPPSLSASFYKAHGLGNDYLVFEEGDRWVATPPSVERVCDRYRGVGSDGIVVLLGERSGELFRSRMFNPDGSEFERSGNGLRILASYIARGDMAPSPFNVSVGGNTVSLAVHGRLGTIYDASVEMGQAGTGPESVGLRPGALDTDGSLEGPGGQRLKVVPISVGNPHLVVFEDEPTEERLAEVGPFLTTHPALAHGSNVQLARVLDERTLEALIWERGVGRTEASGTSACAVAVAAVSEGLAPPGELTVVMPGGSLSVAVSPDLEVVLRGPVEEVCTGVLTEATLEALKAHEK